MTGRHAKPARPAGRSRPASLPATLHPWSPRRAPRLSRLSRNRPPAPPPHSPPGSLSSGLPARLRRRRPLAGRSPKRCRRQGGAGVVDETSLAQLCPNHPRLVRVRALRERLCRQRLACTVAPSRTRSRSRPSGRRRPRKSPRERDVCPRTNILIVRALEPGSVKTAYSALVPPAGGGGTAQARTKAAPQRSPVPALRCFAPLISALRCGS